MIVDRNHVVLGVKNRMVHYIEDAITLLTAEELTTQVIQWVLEACEIMDASILVEMYMATFGISVILGEKNNLKPIISGGIQRSHRPLFAQ